MKKITFNAPLNHKAYSYEPMKIEVEKVISLYGKRFEQMRDHPLDDCPEIIENRDLMYMKGNTAHCILFLDANGSDGILVEAEGSDYARKSQFIPNAENAELLTVEWCGDSMAQRIPYGDASADWTTAVSTARAHQLSTKNHSTEQSFRQSMNFMTAVTMWQRF